MDETLQLKEKLASYVEEFNQNDEECHETDIPNRQAFDFLLEEIPLIDIPDKTIERAYYFRWWTYRKHIRKTPYGFIITEFLPDVPWAGAYNSINCAFWFHLREGRWMKNAKTRLRDYALFFLEGHGQAFTYSMSLVNALWEYAKITGDTDFLKEHYEQIQSWFEQRNAKAATPWGLYYSVDNYDGMEYSISGSGLRPTINSYVYGDAIALAEIAKLLGRQEEAAHYTAMAEKLAEMVNRYLFDGSFYKTIPEGEEEAILLHGKERSREHNCRELIGYLPWLYGLADEGKNAAWTELLKETGFASDWGLTTAERNHFRFMEAHDHECLWNGPIWPFATSQTLTALTKAMNSAKGELPVPKEQYCALIHQYAKSHQLREEGGTNSDDPKAGKVPDWIDEDMDPFTGEWLARKILKSQGFPKHLGGYERGKDYNHSLFCDLVLEGLLGIQEGVRGEPIVHPLVPDSWKSFRIENLHFHGKRYTVVYRSSGITVQPM